MFKEELRQLTGDSRIPDILVNKVKFCSTSHIENSIERSDELEKKVNIPENQRKCDN